MAFVAAAVFAVTLAGILARPRALPESAIALTGAGVVIAIGAIAPRTAADVLWQERGVFAFLAGVLALATVAERVGVFDVAAAAALRGARGSVPRLFWLVVAVAAVGTALLSLDAVVVALTPAVLLATRRADVGAEPFLFATVGVANAASIALPIANPTNVVITDRAGIGFAQYAAIMLPVALAATVAVGGVLALRFRPALRGRIEVPGAAVVPRSPLLAFGALIAGTLVALVALPGDLGPVMLVSGVVAVGALLVTGRIEPRRAALAFGPRLLLFAAGIFVLVEAVERHGLRELLARHAPAAPAGVGLVGAGLANVVNNLPATVLAAPLATDHDRAYALLVGVDAGPNLLLTGSLATLLWLAIARERDAAVSAWRFLAVGLLMAPAGVAAGLLVLALGG